MLNVNHHDDNRNESLRINRAVKVPLYLTHPCGKHEAAPGVSCLFDLPQLNAISVPHKDRLVF